MDYEPCECCGIRPATDGHHCLVGRDRNKPELDHPYNIERVCRECHMTSVATREHREEFFARQKSRYGQEFLDWWDNLPLKVKPKYD